MAFSRTVINTVTFSEVCSKPEFPVITHNSLVALTVEREGLRKSQVKFIQLGEGKMGVLFLVGLQNSLSSRQSLCQGLAEVGL